MTEPQDTTSAILAREFSLADGLRARVMAVLLAVSAVNGLIFAAFLPDDFDDDGVTRWHFALLCLPVPLGAIVEEWIARDVKRRAARGELSRPWAAWVTVALESLLPTALLACMSVLARETNVLTAPTMFAYSVVMTVTALALNYKLCLYSAAIVSVSNLVFIYWLGHTGRLPPGIDQTVGPHVFRAFFLFATGAAAAFVASQLRQRVEHATIVALSKREALLEGAMEVDLWQNVALELGGGLAFAKVTSRGPPLRLRFTSFDEPAAAARDGALAATRATG